ncbi:MAG: hypothetical protein IKH15_04855 [Bacteroidales bacterium]|nr:hypothetical protein [Bacteroidales bacterium]
MGYRVISFRSDGSDVRKFKEAAMTAKESIAEMCELVDEMSERYSERGSYGERYGERGRYDMRDDYSQRGGYYGRDWDEMNERRYRDSRGRFM